MADRFHVAEYLRDELDARDWTTRDCAERMGDDADVDELALDFLLAMLDSPPDHVIQSLKLDARTANGLEVALGVSAQTWLNLDRAYHEGRNQR